MSPGCIWEDFWAEATGSAKALRRPGGLLRNSEAEAAEHAGQTGGG